MTDFAAFDTRHYRTVDDTWIAAEPKWERFRAHPVSLALAWHLPA